MRFDIMTLFPELVSGVLSESIIGRAQKSGAIEVHAHNIRDYSKDKHRRVDDTPYGGGMGMLMSPVPIYDCYTAITAPEVNSCEKRHVIYMSPKGEVLSQKKALDLASNYDNIVILCGHYEGVDQRLIDEIVDEEISIGNYVLTGGEIPACVLVDCVSRMIDGVLSSAECYEKESFSDGETLEYPQYTRPVEWRGRRVPDVLLSGHHGNIDKWREEEAKRLTEERKKSISEEK
jgi:tRNA (guanine37-N1)-methyltransferase